MEKKELLNYEAPEVEVIEVEVERGFEGSGSYTYPNPFGDDEIDW